MIEYLKEIDDSLFWFCALTGSGLFLIQFLLTLIGDLDNESHSINDFKWLSKQAITGFLMMFGWVGLTCKKEFECTNLTSSFIGFLCGIVAMVITGFIFKMAGHLKSSGTVFCIDDAIGKEATIYQQILKGEKGKISLSLNGFTHEIDAISLDEEIPSFTPVHIINKVDDQTLIVARKK